MRDLPRPRFSVALGLPVFAFALAAGCGLIGFGDDGSAVNQCRDDSACGRNAACDTARHVCVASNRPDAGVYLRLTYPLSFGVESKEFQSQRLDSPADVRIDAPSVAEVRGTVSAGEPARTVPADITFLRPSGIPGISNQAETTTADSAPATGTDWTYSTKLIAFKSGRTPYSIYVEPTGAAADEFPPLVRTLTEGPGGELDALRDESGAPSRVRRLDIDLLPPDMTLLRVEGLVRRGLDPVPNVAVRAIDLESGRRISTISHTAPFTTLAGGEDPPDRPAGTFLIYLSSAYRSTRFRLEILPTGDQPNLPTLTWEGINFDVLDADGDDVLVFDDEITNPAADLPPIAYPALGLPVRLEGRVEGTEPGSAPRAIEGATLRFYRLIPTGTPGFTATFERTATTDERGAIVPSGGSGTGSVGVALLEGDYVVTVTPPGRLPLAGLYLDSFRVAVSDPTGDPVQRGQLFQLGPSAQLHGSVMDLARGPAGSLPVEITLAEAGGDAAGADPTNLVHLVDGYTDSDGLFDLLVENGTHFVAVRPPDASQFPWRVVSNVHVPNGPLDLSLEAPVVLDGTATIGGALTAGVKVEALVRDSQFGTILEVGETETDADGAFRLLLSPSIGTL